MSFHGAAAGPTRNSNCNSNNSNVAKKRRRWSTAHQEAGAGAILAPHRFGMKKQLKTLGRHHPSSNSLSSLNSLASFQSKSNPIFEPSAEPSHSSSSNNSKPPSSLKWYINSSDGPTFANPLGAAGGGTVSLKGGIESHSQPVTKPKSRLGKISPESSILSNNEVGGLWPEEDVDEETEKGIEDPILLMHSPAINGKSKRTLGLVLSRESSRIDFGEGSWPVEEEEGKEFPNERISSLLPALMSSEDGAQSTEGSSRALVDNGSDQEEMLSSIEASERRSRSLMEQVQANAAAELSTLRGYKAVIDQLRADCTKHEAAAKEWSDMHRDTMTRLVSARAEITELQRQGGCPTIAMEERGPETDPQDAVGLSDKLKLETLEREQQDWRQRVAALEMELTATKSELQTAVLREESREAETSEKGQQCDWRQKVEALETELAATKSELSAVVSREERSREAETMTLETEMEQDEWRQKVSTLEMELMAARSDTMEKEQNEQNDWRQKIAVLETELKVTKSELSAAILRVMEERGAVETLEKEQHDWRQKVAALETELTATKSELSAAALNVREERGRVEMLEKEQQDWRQQVAALETKQHEWRQKVASLETEQQKCTQKVTALETEQHEWRQKEAVLEIQQQNWTQEIAALELQQQDWRQKLAVQETELIAMRSQLNAAVLQFPNESQTGSQVVADLKQEIDSKRTLESLEFAAGGLLSADQLYQVLEAKLAEVFQNMEQLKQERDSLIIAVQHAEKRAAEAQSERDTVVLAVQQEWEAVKTALRQEKEKLELELEVIGEHNLKLQNDLDHKTKILEDLKLQAQSRDVVKGEKSLQVFIGDKVIEPGTERGDSLIALWTEYQKLQVELSEAFDHNKKQKNERVALNVALDGVKDGNRRLEGELGVLQAEKIKLEGEREALMAAVQEERQKLENERAVVRKAMLGENEKLESERDVLIAMQDYLEKLQMKKDLAQPVAVANRSFEGEEKRVKELAQPVGGEDEKRKKDLAHAVGGDEKRRRKVRRGVASVN